MRHDIGRGKRPHRLQRHQFGIAWPDADPDQVALRRHEVLRASALMKE